MVCLRADCPFLMRFTAAWVYVAMATAGVSLHEKSKEYETACDLLRQLLGDVAPALVSLHAIIVHAVKLCSGFLAAIFECSARRLPVWCNASVSGSTSVQVELVARTGVGSGGSGCRSTLSISGVQSSLSRYSIPSLNARTPILNACLLAVCTPVTPHGSPSSFAGAYLHAWTSLSLAQNL